MLQRLPIVLTQVKANNTSENLLSEIRQFFYSRKRKRNYWKSIQQDNRFNKIVKQNRYYIYEFCE